MTLKTLKDFETVDEYCEQCACEYGGQIDYSDQRKCVAIEDLRQEAIRRIKEYLGSLDDDCNPEYNVPYMDKSSYRWIKHFFNITEGDLK